jgi:hypothetical protein
MSGYIGQFSYLTKLSTLTKKLEFIRQQTGFESLGHSKAVPEINERKAETAAPNRKNMKKSEGK